MTRIEIANSIAVYAATGVCCGIAFASSLMTVGAKVWRERD